MEWIMGIQTVILGITALFILWYTFETQKLRKETVRQSTIMQRQLSLLLQDQKERKEAMQNAARPILTIKGANYNAVKTRVTIANIGGIIHDVQVDFGDGIFSSISNTLDEGDNYLSLNSPLGSIKGESEMLFTMRYTNSLDQRIVATFEMVILRKTITQKSFEIQ